MSFAFLNFSSLQHSAETFDLALANYFRVHSNDPSFISWEFIGAIGHGRCVGIILGSLLLILTLKKRYDRGFAILMTVPGMYLGELVKILVHRTRPDPTVENGYSFPSGHALTATLAYGMILILVLPLLTTRTARFFACTFTVLLVFFIGLARVAVGAHYYSDVIVAIVFGALWLELTMRLTEVVKRWYQARRSGGMLPANA
jgi:undecaprenyl-diphosphatase